ncbi:hypothetical protein D6789_03505 [Candidatus Woesearchaeota archaeon]|nr:MAG: hypothetical protein D6789_03505 [Candidatus Woesearchaeota archaeon]
MLVLVGLSCWLQPKIYKGFPVHARNMELNVIEKKKGRLVFELPGEDHTFCNALKTELWNDKDVKAATYSVKHPLLPVPKFIIEAKTDALKALKGAIERLQKQYRTMGTAFKKL